MGADTLPVDGGNMEECIHCERRVAWDLVDHSFFGFASSGCPERDQTSPEQDA